MQPVGDIWGSIIFGGIIPVHTELGVKIYFKKPHKISKKKGGEEGYAIENTDNKILAPLQFILKNSSTSGVSG